MLLSLEYHLPATDQSSELTVTSSTAYGQGYTDSRAANNSIPDSVQMKISRLSYCYRLESNEVQRLCSILKQWPEDLWDQGVDEVLENVLASRELAQLAPLTLEKLLEVKMILAHRGESQ